MKRLFVLCLGTLCMLLGVATMWGQTGTSGVNGTVTDPQGENDPGRQGDAHQPGHECHAHYEVDGHGNVRL